MKLWKENRLDQEWVLSAEEVAKRFMESGYAKEYLNYGGVAMALVYFITSKDGLNSTWEWDEKKGSIEGSPDMLAILEIVEPKLLKR